MGADKPAPAEPVSFWEVVQDVFSLSGFSDKMLTTRYLSRLIFVLSFFALASYMNSVSAVVAGWHTPNIIILGLDGQPSLGTRHNALPDLGHSISVSLQNAFPGFFAYVSSFQIDWNDAALSKFGFPIIMFGLSHPKRLLIVRRVCFIFGCINVLRACCIAMTSMPDASPMCTSQFTDAATGAYKATPIFPRAFHRAFRVMLNPSENITCGDMIFSGHTVFITLTALMIRKYYTAENCNTPLIRYLQAHTAGLFLPLLRAFFSFGVLYGVVVFIGTRLHYTLDVFIALAVTNTVWWVYHTIAENDALRSCSRVISWLEDDHVREVDQLAYRSAIKSFKTR